MSESKPRVIGKNEVRPEACKKRETGKEGNRDEGSMARDLHL
jgi:hypothetical protein